MKKLIDSFILMHDNERWTVHYRTADNTVTALQVCSPDHDYRHFGNGEFVSTKDTPRAIAGLIGGLGYSI